MKWRDEKRLKEKMELRVEQKHVVGLVVASFAFSALVFIIGLLLGGEGVERPIERFSKSRSQQALPGSPNAETVVKFMMTIPKRLMGRPDNDDHGNVALNASMRAAEDGREQHEAAKESNKKQMEAELAARATKHGYKIVSNGDESQQEEYIEQESGKNIDPVYSDEVGVSDEPAQDQKEAQKNSAAQSGAASSKKDKSQTQQPKQAKTADSQDKPAKKLKDSGSSAETSDAKVKDAADKVAQKDNKKDSKKDTSEADAKSKETDKDAEEPAVQAGTMYSVQVGAFSQEEAADKCMARLRQTELGKKHPPFKVPVDTAKGKMYRVRMGRFHKKSSAENFRRKLEKQEGARVDIVSQI